MTQVVLVKGKTYFYKNFQFTVNQPKAVDNELAVLLLAVKNDLGVSVFKKFTKETQDEIDGARKGALLKERGDLSTSEMVGLTGKAAPTKVEKQSEVIIPDEEEIKETPGTETIKSTDFAIPKAVEHINKLTDVQSLLDFTSGDERKGILAVKEDLLEKMGPSGAGMSEEEAIIV